MSVGSRSWRWPLLACVLVVLVVAALRLWSPLVVLGVAVTSSVGFAAFSFIASLGGCGHSRLAGDVQWAGALAVGGALGLFGIRRGPHALWAFFVGWVAAGAWIAAWAHLLPGGSGGCSS